MGKHSKGTNSVFWRTLFLSILKWIAISTLPILAVVGGWNWLRDRNSPQTPGDDNPAMVGSGESDASPASGSSPEPETVSSQILNGSRNPQFLEVARTKLEKAGYEILTTGNASRPYEKTTVFYQVGHRNEAGELARLVGASVTEAAPENLDKSIPLALVVGADFKP